jgi:hypothetical protein
MDAVNIGLSLRTRPDTRGPAGQHSRVAADHARVVATRKPDTTAGSKKTLPEVPSVVPSSVRGAVSGYGEPLDDQRLGCSQRGDAAHLGALEHRRGRGPNTTHSLRRARAVITM